MKKLYYFLTILFPFIVLFDKKFWKREEVEEIPMPIILSGKQMKLVRDYPLKNIKLTRGKIYDIVDEYKAEKRISAYATIPLNFKSIVNDEGEVVLVTPLYFEEI